MLILDSAERFRQLLAYNPTLKTPNKMTGMLGHNSSWRSKMERQFHSRLKEPSKGRHGGSGHDDMDRTFEDGARPPMSLANGMNQQCKVCNEPAAGFHFGAFTCEGCKSFFGRTYNNIGSISQCKNNGECVINKKNRTSCKACRLRKCFLVGMSKSGSRYGRRSNWFKIHCLLQEQGTSLPFPPDEKPETDEEERRWTSPDRRSITPVGFLPYARPLVPMFVDPWPRDDLSSSPSPGVVALEQDAPIDLSVRRRTTNEQPAVLDLTKR